MTAGRERIVDCHAHLMPPAWQAHGRMPPDLFAVDALVTAREADGVTTTVVSDPHIWYGELEPGTERWTREYNDFAAELTRDHPGRLVALATVTPWDPDQWPEVARAVDELGLPGIAVATSHRDAYLDTVPGEFWELVAERGVPVFVHPGGTTLADRHMGEYRLGEVCGRPLDMTLTLARLILTGGMERHPGVRLLCAHAGGAIGTIADRLDFGHELRDYAPLGPWGEVELPRPPSEYVARLHLDTVTYGTAGLRLALERVGAGQLLFGTDHPPVPFPVARSLGHVEALGLDPADRAAVLGGNATALFGLPV